MTWLHTQVSTRVRQALRKRDGVIEDLRKQVAELQAAQTETEALLEKQRRELLGASTSDAQQW